MNKKIEYEDLMEYLETQLHELKVGTHPFLYFHTDDAADIYKLAIRGIIKWTEKNYANIM